MWKSTARSSKRLWNDAAGRIPIMAGTGANSTREAIAPSRFAKQVGADCALSVVPYYESHPKRDLPALQGHRRGRRSADHALQRAGPDGRRHAARHHPALPGLPGVFGIKKPAATSRRAAYLIKHAPKRFHTYSGDDGTAIALMLLGGHGNVSVTANVAPRAMAELCRKALAGDAIGAREIHLRLLGLHKQLFCRAQPGARQWAMRQLGLCGDAVRLRSRR